ncbi:hypothetical protein BC938DRAFT_484205 [Jimgerdemannia flammicorona]|uniref:Uncharacterized protein n=1 Tax=Jimgerdemannia flammicorona TaxID=994334 RepID=A0A433QAH1_9FUNG|nr:hypothetical protein BC938DRAFT_484205 [Jimgerdemannia flammicorona]
MVLMTLADTCLCTYSARIITARTRPITTVHDTQAAAPVAATTVMATTVMVTTTAATAAATMATTTATTRNADPNRATPHKGPAAGTEGQCSTKARVVKGTAVAVVADTGVTALAATAPEEAEVTVAAAATTPGTMVVMTGTPNAAAAAAHEVGAGVDTGVRRYRRRRSMGGMAIREAGQVGGVDRPRRLGRGMGTDHSSITSSREVRIGHIRVGGVEVGGGLSSFKWSVLDV